ncbi:MAG: sugar kinase [Nocardioidaceae bacterium]
MVEAYEAVAIGEVMGLLDPESSGPLEDVSHFRLRVAGAEGNVLINLSHLGHSTAFVSAVGADPLGRLVTRTLAEQGVDIRHVSIDPTRRTGVFFKERLGDAERRVHYYREGSAASCLGPEQLDLDRLGAPKVVTLSGVTLGLGGVTGLSAAAREVLAWASGQPSTVVFDPNLRPALWYGARAAAEFAEILPQIDVLLTGRDELAQLMPTLPLDDAARRLCDAGLTAVVLKDGARGAVVHDGRRATRIEAYPVGAAAIDPVGAGDAFAAGVISGLLHGWPVRDGARVGAVLGARAVTISGDWEPVASGDDAEHLLQEYLSVFGVVGERA